MRRRPSWSSFMSWDKPGGTQAGRLAARFRRFLCRRPGVRISTSAARSSLRTGWLSGGWRCSTCVGSKTVT
eukprot:6697208-Pyramimonas_sp.AAC.1